MIPFAKPYFDRFHYDAVNRVLESGRLTGGPMIKDAEARLAELCGAKHCVLVSSCTAALNIMLNDAAKVITPFMPSLTHVATHMASQGPPIYLDVDENGIMVMHGHFGETPVDYLGQKAPRHRLALVDAAHSLHTLDGAMGQCLSFHPPGS